MTQFDPYRKWLGIPSAEQPADHYRLLGIGRFESDPDVISTAADRQMVHVRTFQSGKRSELSQEILNELATARLTLLTPEKKDAYDAQLRERLATDQPAAPPPPPPSAVAPPVGKAGLAPPVPAADAIVPKIAVTPKVVGVETFPKMTPPSRKVAEPSRPGARDRESGRRNVTIAAFALLIFLVCIFGVLGGWWSSDDTPVSTRPRRPGPQASPPVTDPVLPPRPALPTQPPSEEPEEPPPIDVVDTPTDGPGHTAKPPDPPPEADPPAKIRPETAPDVAEPEEDKLPGPEPADTTPVDVWTEKIHALEETIQANKSTPARVWVERALTMADKAVEAGNFEAADRCFKIAGEEAKKDRAGAFDEKFLSKLVASRHRKQIEERQKVPDAATLPVFGATEASEEAVDRALAWLAKRQLSDGPPIIKGRWCFAHDETGKCNLKCTVNAATAVALLPFLAPGNRPQSGELRTTAKSGLALLGRRMTYFDKDTGSLHQFGGGSMPSHALGTIALCEGSVAYGERAFGPFAKAAVSLILESQLPGDSGWPRPCDSPQELVRRMKELRRQVAARQRPDLPPSDVYFTAWNVIALKVALWAGVEVDGIENGLQRAGAYLASPRVRGQPVLRRGRIPNPNSTTLAAATLAQMFTGCPENKREFTNYVNALAGTGSIALDYYNTQIMRNYGGPSWKTWNAAVRDALVAQQVREGHAAGSWNPAGSDRSVSQGGRLFCTALAALTLEVSYRYPPLYE